MTKDKDGPNFRILNRKLHRWGSIAVALPFLVVIVSGLLLQVKKQVPWVQPPEQRTENKIPQVTMEQVIALAQSVPEAQVKEWSDIDRLDVRPSKGLLKVITTSNWELQVDLKTGALLQSTYRRSDIIETLHDGSWFHDNVKLYVFLPVAVIVFGLWVTGIYLFFLPYWVKANRRRA
ncbi:MAG: PepSY domain-containing protein [Gemmatimonadaceae bacterium]|nr:PepSY domain-containing protein [Gemmatimonadaceae bacterium]